MKTTGLAAMVASKTAALAIGLTDDVDLNNHQATKLENIVTGRSVTVTRASQTIASPDAEADRNAITPTMPYTTALSRAANKAPMIVATRLWRDCMGGS